MSMSPTSTLSRFGLLAFALMILALPVVPADAQERAPEGGDPAFRRVTGISVSVNGTTGNDADFDVNMNTSNAGVYTYSTTAYGRYIGAVPGSLGGSYQVVRSIGASAARVTGILNSPAINAIEFGSTASTPVTNTSISLVTPGVPGSYRGNFVHTYPAPGSYTVRTGAVFNFLGFRRTTGSQGVVTGNPVVASTLNYTSIYAFYVGPATTATYSFGPYNATGIPPYTVGATNTAEVVVGGDAGPPTVEIPTVSELGLLALALALGLAGIAVLRR